MDDECFEKGENDKKSLRVFLINPPISEPWRTRQDYIDDRKQMEESFQRSVEAHELLKKSFRRNRLEMVIAFFTMVAAMIGAFIMLDGFLDKKMELFEQLLLEEKAAKIKNQSKSFGPGR